MNSTHTYSDEYINAYIDGELDSDERARFLFDEQSDEALAQRINETRMLKEKIQLSYSDIRNKNDEKKSFSCTAFASRHRALAASLLFLSTVIITLAYTMSNNDDLILAKQLINNTNPISASAMSDTIGDHKRVVINVSQYDPSEFSATIKNIESLLLREGSRSLKVEIVANKQGLKALDTVTSSHAAQISQLANRFDNLEIIACAKSLANLATEGDPIQLMKSIMIAPSAAEQVAKRTSAGWLYLKI